MARIGLPHYLISLALGLCLLPRTAAQPPADQAQAITATLAMQEAMRQGRELLQRGQTKEAVDVLEAQLTRINGNALYLALVREAYYAYIKELQLSHQDDLYATYLKRLQILEKNARTAATPAPPPEKTDRSEHSDTVPLQQTTQRNSPAGRELLPEAEKAFAEKRYRDADELFARAYGSDPVAPSHASQWAYSKLNNVVARLQETEADNGHIPVAEFESEVATALRLAANNPELDAFGRKVLESIRQHTTVAGVSDPGHSTPSPATPTVTVKHQERGSDGWARAESANFRLFHNQPREIAEQIVRAAEQARTAAFEKWAGPPPGDWQPACEVYLHAAAAEYARNTGKPANSPGHATFQVQNNAVVRRRLDLRADEPNTLTCVIPHETTHLVLGDLFADAPLPRWADEGMAVLAESRTQIDRYNRTLHSCRQQGKLLPLTQVLGESDYPEASLITVFYVESVSVVDYLVAEKGPRAFTQFLRDVQQSGLEAALTRHYGYRTVAELQQRWLTRTFAESDARAAAKQNRQ